jgi:signal transduction histidine kinase
VRAIAERHQGRVIVEGARFTIDLPTIRSAHVLAEDTPGRH